MAASNDAKAGHHQAPGRVGSGLLLALAQLCTCSGMCWFALAKAPHWKQVRGQRPQSTQVNVGLRVLGSIALLASLWPCLLADHASMAVLVWFMLLALTALTVTFTLSWQPRLLQPWVIWLRT